MKLNLNWNYHYNLSNLVLFKIVNTLENFVLQTNFEDGEREMIEAKINNLI